MHPWAKELSAPVVVIKPGKRALQAQGQGRGAVQVRLAYLKVSLRAARSKGSSVMALWGFSEIWASATRLSWRSACCTSGFRASSKRVISKGKAVCRGRRGPGLRPQRRPCPSTPEPLPEKWWSPGDRGPACSETTKPRPGVLEILKLVRQLSLNPSREAPPTSLRPRPPLATSEPEVLFLLWVQEGITLGIYSVGRVEELRSIWASTGRSIHRVLAGTGCPDSQPLPPPGSFPCAKSGAHYPARDLGSLVSPKCRPQGNLPLASPAVQIRPPRGSLSYSPCCALPCGL